MVSATKFRELAFELANKATFQKPRIVSRTAGWPPQIRELVWKQHHVSCGADGTTEEIPAPLGL